MPQQPITYEVFPRSIRDNTFILTSVKTELNGFHSVNTEYAFKYILFRNETGIYLKQYVSSHKEAGISVLLNFFEKLYSGNIAFKKTNNPIVVSKPLHFYSIGLNHHHSLQIKKPGELGLNTFSSSAGLIENTLNEVALNLNVGEFVRFNFSITPSEYDQITKEVLYTIKEIGKSEEYKQELRSSFTDKLDFFLFDLKVSHNLKDETFFSDVLYKNLRLYDSNWNYYAYEHSNKTFPKLSKRKRKGQMDMFLSHGLVTLVSENNRYVSKLPSVVMPITPPFALNGGAGKKKGEMKTFIGKGFRDLRLNNQGFVSMDADKYKNAHSFILGGSGAGKSYSTSQMIGFDVIRIIEDEKRRFENGELFPRSQILVYDPHLSLYDNIETTLSWWNEMKEFRHLYDFKFFFHSRDDSDEVSVNALKLPIVRKKLIFNPLYLRGSNPLEPATFIRQVQRATEACLDGLKGIYDFSAFGSQNSEILSTVIKLFIVFNGLKNHTDTSLPYTLGDIHRFLKYLEINKGIPDWLMEDFRMALNASPEIATVVQELKDNVDFYEKQLKTPGYLSSSINKVSDFSEGLKETFGYGSHPDDYSVYLDEFFTKKDYQFTTIHFFDLSGFTQKEKAIVSSFHLAYSYHYGTTRDHSNKKDLTQTSVWIDESDVLLQGQNIQNLVSGTMAQIRKFGFKFSFFWQSCDQDGYKMLYPNIGVLLVFSVDSRQFDLIGPDLNSGCFGKQIEAKDVINNQRGRFYGLFKLVNGGNSTLLIQGLSMNRREFEYLIS